MISLSRLSPVLLAAFSLLAAGAARAATASDSAEEEAALAFGDKDSISLATGSKQSLRRAPAVATVITAEEIAAMGATDLDEVLETVPGLHVSRNNNSYMPRYIIRGMFSTFNAEVLMLVNGVPMTSIYTGDRGNAWFGLPVDNISRIEVVRGPGSALYGAEALAGVINIVTKTADEIAGTQAGVRAGSFASRDGFVLHGGHWGEVEVAAYLRSGRTDGQREIVEADQQTVFDGQTGGNASLAPGPVNLGYRATDGQLDLAYGHLRLRAGLKKRDNAGTGAGIAAALDPAGRSHSERTTADLSYDNRELAPGFGLKVAASYFHYEEGSDLVIFPPGGFFGGYPNGMIGNPYKWERHGRFSLAGDYRGWTGHQLRLGGGAEKLSLYKVRESKNFNPDFSPIGSVVDVSATVPFLSPHDRYLRYVYLQDEWAMHPDWTLTAGLRHDRYSDFGNTTNPRLALVWAAAYDLTAKLLYGRAFRAPSMADLYAINNPASLGNPNLKPETADTTELAINWQAREKVRVGANIFRYVRKDMILYVAQSNGTTRTENIGRVTGQGGELEVDWSVLPSLKLTANYAYQETKDRATGEDAGFAPRQHAYARADWRFASGWQANSQINWVADRRRAAGDNRPTVADYHTVDFTVRTANKDGWSLALSIRNAFDANAREPAASSIPNDLPLAGRSAWAEVRYGL